MAFSSAVSISINTPVLIEQHLNCSICLGLFKDPVTTPCGHTFCQTYLECNLHFNDLICPVCKEEPTAIYTWYQYRVDVPGHEVDIYIYVGIK
uniref:RING-type domain-containing protein n=1 Tax=Oncorhynchus kisutch TaxID=8019 RepID=A0A8C7DLB4_ONCKI